jgi:hypothetical protein
MPHALLPYPPAQISLHCELRRFSGIWSFPHSSRTRS